MRTHSLALSLCVAIGCSSAPGVESTLDLTSSSPDGRSDAPDLGSGSDGGAPDLLPGDAGVWGFSETFPGADGAAWPSRWQVLGGAAAQSQQGGRGRLLPFAGSYALARMGTTDGARDINVTFQLQFENIATQGVGFYVRQNGGYLRNTATRGEGYAIFIEGFRGSRLGVWKEVDGQEIELVPFTAFPAALQSNVLYQARLRVTQAAPNMTRLQARLWIAAQAEPATWQIDTQDGTPSLQNVAGGMAVDSYSSQMSGTVSAATFVDNIIAGPG